MGPSRALAVIAFFSSSCAAMVYRTDAPCDFTDVHLDDEIISQLLAKLPEDLAYGPQGFDPFLLGIDIGGLTLHGLSKLRPLGPPIPYCAKGKRMVEVDLYNDDLIYFSAPWKTCSGHQGELKLIAMFFRFTAQFSILETTGEGVKLEFERGFPVTTQTIRVLVEGAPTGVRDIFEVLGILVPKFPEEIWMGQFWRNVERALRKTHE